MAGTCPAVIPNLARWLPAGLPGRKVAQRMCGGLWEPERMEAVFLERLSNPPRSPGWPVAEQGLKVRFFYSAPFRGCR